MKRWRSPVVLLWLVAALLSAIAVFAAFDRVQVETNEARTDAQRENEILCRAFEQDVSRSVAGIDVILQFFTAHYEKDLRITGDIQSMLNVLSQRPIFHIVALVDAAGTTIASSEAAIHPVNIADLPHIAIHRNSNQAGLYIGKPIRIRTAGEDSIP